MARWTMNDLKAKGIFVNPEGKAKKLEAPAKKKITKAQINKAIKKTKKEQIDGKTFINLFLISLNVDFVNELQFSDGRKFRFDWAIKEHLIAIEYEGLMSEKSRHTTKQGYSTDTTKYNLAIQEGWKVYRYTALTFENIIEDLRYLQQ